MSVKAKVTRYQHPLDLFQPGLTNDDDAVVDVQQLLIKMIITVMIMMSDVDANYCDDDYDDNDDGG